MSRLRLFIALFPPEELRNSIVKQVAGALNSSNVRYVSAESLHITLKFLGDSDESQLDRIKQGLLEQSALLSPFQLCFASAGAFPSVKKARVFWFGISGETGVLINLAQNIEAKAVEWGFLKENRLFSPHLTVAKSKGTQVPKAEAERFCKLFSNFQSSMFSVSSIALVRSRLGSQESHYEILDSFPLGRSA